MGKWWVLTGGGSISGDFLWDDFAARPWERKDSHKQRAWGRGGGRGPNTGRWWVKTDSGRQIWAQPACKALTFAPPPPQPELLLQGPQSHLEKPAVGGPVGSPGPEVFAGGGGTLWLHSPLAAPLTSYPNPLLFSSSHKEERNLPLQMAK